MENKCMVELKEINLYKFATHWVPSKNVSEGKLLDNSLKPNIFYKTMKMNNASNSDSDLILILNEKGLISSANLSLEGSYYILYNKNCNNDLFNIYININKATWKDKI